MKLRATEELLDSQEDRRYLKKSNRIGEKSLAKEPLVPAIMRK